MAPIAYRLSVGDAGWYYPDPAPIGTYCPSCGSPRDYLQVSRVAEVKRGRDCLYTYDGHFLVSDRFRRFCLDNGYTDVEFEVATKKGDLYDLRPTRILEVDIARTKPRLDGFCVRCGQFKGIHTAIADHRIHKGVDSPLPDGIYRSDLVWGAGGKSPTVLVAPVTRDKIKAAGFKGLVYFAIMPPAIEALGLPRKASR
jgi:hypothetical protein